MSYRDGEEVVQMRLKNPMEEEISKAEELHFSLKVIARNLVANKTVRNKEEVQVISSAFNKFLCSYLEKPEYNQTS